MTTPTNPSFPAHAIAICPGGLRITTYVGRKDSTNPAPGGLLPDVHASSNSLSALFADKSFSAADLAALLGAHSASKQFQRRHLQGRPAAGLDAGAVGRQVLCR